MAFGFNFTVKGDYALFTRPEFGVERVSYDVPTPSALVGLISSVYWHPGVKYVIDEIRIYNPVNFVNIRRNEVSDKIPIKSITDKMSGKAKDLGINIICKALLFRDPGFSAAKMRNSCLLLRDLRQHHINMDWRDEK